MNFIIYGVDFKHKPGEFCIRSISKLFFVSCFRTDFLTEIDGRLIPPRRLCDRAYTQGALVRL